MIFVGKTTRDLGGCCCGGEVTYLEPSLCGIDLPARGWILPKLQLCFDLLCKWIHLTEARQD